MDERKRAIEKIKNNKKRWLVGCRYALHAGISLSFPIFFSVFLVVRVFVLKSSSLEARKQNKKKILSSQHRSIYTRIWKEEERVYII